MRPNAIKRKLAGGEVVMGMMHFTASPMLVEVMASAGLDFFIIDFEHSPIDLQTAAHLVRAGDAAGIAPLLRIPEIVDVGLVKKVLNLGVQGIVLPHATLESCRTLINAAWYEPDGMRGSCPAVRQAGYWQADWQAFQAEANREILLIPLIEDPQTVREFATLAAMPGLEVFFLGPFDFAVAAGVPGAGFDHPVIAQALERMVSIARTHGKYVMTSVGDRIDTDYGRSLIRQGVRMISYSADALVFRRACLDIAQLKTPG